MVEQNAVVLPAPPQPPDVWSRNYANQLYRWMESLQRQVTGFPYLRGSGLFFPENALPTSDTGQKPGTVYVGGGALLVAGGGGSANTNLAALAALTMAANQGIYFTDPDTAAPFDVVPEPQPWTPTISFGGSSAGVTYSAQLGQYIKFGKLVYARFVLVLTSNGTGVGAAVVGGLPFAPAPNSSAILGSPVWAGCAGIVGNPFGAVSAGSTNISLAMSSATASVAMTDANITDTATLVMSGCYVAA